MDDVRTRESWLDGKFLLKLTRDSDALVVSGGGVRHPETSLPPGKYTLRLAVSETKLKDEMPVAVIPKNGQAVVTLEEQPAGVRFILTGVDQWDADTRRVCEHSESRIDAMDPLGWLAQPTPRIARKACLMDLLAKARALPSARKGKSLCPQIRSIHWADVDRINVKAEGLLRQLGDLPAWKDNGPIHPIHAKNIARIFGGEPGDYEISSFREPVGLNSLQVVCGVHKTARFEVAELDIDLGNPKRDLKGFVVHLGELLDPGRTNHLDLFRQLRGGITSDFLFYRLE
jgi:hypothetical protein